MNYAEHMLMEDESQWPSWANLGRPPICDFVSVFVQLLEAGADLCDKVMKGGVEVYLRVADGAVHTSANGVLDTPELKTMKIALAKAAFGECGYLYLSKSWRGWTKEAESEKTEHEREFDPCAICLEPCSSATELPCSHTFCKDCISAHGRVNAASGCPLCRSLLPPVLTPGLPNQASTSNQHSDHNPSHPNHQDSLVQLTSSRL